MDTHPTFSAGEEGRVGMGEETGHVLICLCAKYITFNKLQGRVASTLLTVDADSVTYL